jgi:hypothetical protein
MIEEPTQKQLQAVEELQKEGRMLLKRKLEQLHENDIESFATKIFRVQQIR